jgi:outer membrane lipoprotein-sorting protein
MKVAASICYAATFIYKLLFMNLIVHVLSLFYLVVTSVSVFSQASCISVHMTSQSLSEGKKYVQQANCYFNNESGVFTIHYYEPNHFVKITNRKGEMKLYFPELNQVSIKQDFYFSSENELLYYFVNNFTDDLGLRKEGFNLTKSWYEGEYLITLWAAPPELPGIHSIKMVFEEMKPIYSVYTDIEGNILKKIYYSDYYETYDFVLPANITEISYPADQDSVIRRILYSDIKLNKEVDPAFLNFTIPPDAKTMD